MFESNKNKIIYVTEDQFKVMKNLESECKKHITGFDKQLWVHGLRNIFNNEIADHVKETIIPVKFETIKDRCPL